MKISVLRDKALPIFMQAMSWFFLPFFQIYSASSLLLMSMLVSPSI